MKLFPCPLIDKISIENSNFSLLIKKGNSILIPLGEIFYLSKEMQMKYR